MTATVLSLAFISRSDTELACGENMILKAQMDYLAESGLEHAKGLLLNPQDVESQYWTGAARQQVYSGSDYYDVSVSRLDHCNYQLTSAGYREKAGQRVGQSSLKAELRLDPCIAFWAGSNWTSCAEITVNGDVYCNGDLGGPGAINGDAYASGTVSATNVTGQENEAVATAPVEWPGLLIADFSPIYYVNSTSYMVEIVDANIHPVGNFYPSEGTNPAGVRYNGKDLELPGGVNITGMLIVNGNLRITGAGNVITAVKNFPALLVSGELKVENAGTLEVNGLAQIGQRVLFDAGAVSANISIVGGLFIAAGDIDGLGSGLNSINITAAPEKASIEIWPQAGVSQRWSPAAGAFFRDIQRSL
jgi:hypothetical protein